MKNVRRKRNKRKKQSRRNRLNAFGELEPRNLLTVCNVINTDDAGPGSFRDAIDCANTTPGLDTIAFDIPGEGPHTILPLTGLPFLTDPVIIDGTTEPDFVGTPIIELDGTNVTDASGLTISTGADGSEVRGLVINRFLELNNLNTLREARGIVVDGADNVTISGNFVGTDVTGTVGLDSIGAGTGVWVEDAEGTIVGGTAPADRNLLSSKRWGIWFSDDSSGHVAQGNFVGTDITGTVSIPTESGIVVRSPDTAIGGTTPGARNVISGNSVNGIALYSSNATVQGNYIGIDVTGNVALGNSGGNGILINGSGTNNLIGGSEPGAGNVVSGNRRGIFVSGGVGGGSNRIQGNRIGTNAAGDAPLRNDTSGIIITGSDNNIIGTDSDGDGDEYEANLISGNRFHGVELVQGSSQNVVAGNFIGPDVTGLLPIGNQISGVFFGNGSTDNLIGGSIAGTRNVISSNGTGVQIKDGSLNTIAGNFIGTDVTGTGDLGNTADGVRIDTGTGNVIGGSGAGEGNVLSGNTRHGVAFFDAAIANRVEGNLIGIDANGTVPLPNDFGGVVISNAIDTVLGGSVAGAGNVISGSTEYGVNVRDAIGTTIQGNLIGIDPVGSTAVGNEIGIIVTNSSVDTTIGGTDPLERNVISGNTDGIVLEATSAGNVIQGNFLGTDVTGTFAIGNLDDGIVNRAAGTIIGGTTAGAGNVIAANTGAGITLETDSSGVSIKGNLIGTDFSGTMSLGNLGSGIEITSPTGATTIGGTNPEDQNIIAFSQGDGVLINSGVSQTVRGNQIYGNQGIAIDLDGDGPTANDPNDVDSGANRLQNFPIVNSVNGGATTQITGTLESTPNANFELDFYSSINPANFGQGERYLGSTSVTADAAGQLNYDVTFPVASFPGELVVATATDPFGNTSEYSDPLAVMVPGAPAIDEENLIITVVEEVDDTVAANFGIVIGEIEEGQTFRLDGLFDSPNAGDHTVVVTWGDGSPDSTVVVPSGRRGFTVEHQYADDDPTTTPVDDYAVRVQVTNTAGQSGIANVSVTVVNAVPSILAPLTLSANDVSEGDFVTLTGQFEDPSLLDNHIVEINWGDGSPVQTVTLDVGEREFVVPHQYLDDTKGDTSPITVTLYDDDSGSTTSSILISVDNVAPTAAISGQPNGFEGTVAEFQAIANDPAALDTLTYKWTVENDDEQIASSTETLFSFVPPDNGEFKVKLTVTDDDAGLSETAMQTLNVSNLPPEIFATDLMVVAASPNEGEQVELSGSFSDLGVNDTHDLIVDWGDGSATTIVELAAGVTTFDGVLHTYLDDDPTATSADIYDILVTVIDNEGASASTTYSVTVNNLPPVPEILNAGSDETTVRLEAAVTDDGTDDFTYLWSVQGVVLSDPTLDVIDFPRASLADAFFEASLTVTDDDGGVGTTSFVFVGGTDNNDVINVDPMGTDVAIEINGAPAEMFNASQIVVAAGEGDDMIMVDAAVTADVVIDGGMGDDMIMGGAGDDVLMGGPGADELFGGAGNDKLQSDEGDDELTGNEGNDTYVISSFSDKVLTENPGEGIDTLDFSQVGASAVPDAGITLDLSVNDGTMQAVRDDGNVSLIGEFENLVGTNFNDKVFGTSASNVLVGGEGNDELFANGENVNTGNDGNDTIFGGMGEDTITGGDGDESLSGGEGNDTIFGGMGEDSVDGGDGNDSLTSGGGGDTIFGGMGEDTISGGDGNESLVGGEGNDTIFGGMGEDTIDGGDGNDTLTSGEGNDTIFGGGGNDAIFGGVGRDSIDGGAGNDMLTSGDGACDPNAVEPCMGDTIFGGMGEDTIVGGDANESLIGGSGNDTIFGGMGEDSIEGGDGNDTLTSGGGGDTIFGGAGADTIVGGDGNESLVGGTGNDTIFGGMGTDTVHGGDGNDTLTSGGGNDTIFGGMGADTIMGGDGNESLVGGDGNDTIFGGLGDDSINGGAGNDMLTAASICDPNSADPCGDTIFGGTGEDTITGGDGNDTLNGGEGNDTIFGGMGEDSIDGGDGNDTLTSGGSGDTIFGGMGEDTIMGGDGNETLNGGGGNDTIFGGMGEDSIVGGDGNDTLTSGGGDDTIFGGMGEDTIEGGDGDESLVGGEGNDTIFGGMGEDTIEGGDGNDTLTSGGGNDTIFGGMGEDTIEGGDGNESLVGGEGNDTIFGGMGEDTIEGGDGNDTLTSGGGDDTIFGGMGEDSITGGAGSESLVGGEGDDTIFGGGGDATRIDGGLGDDFIEVGAGASKVVFGGDGNDTISGGDGTEQIYGGDDLASGSQFSDWVMKEADSNMTLAKTSGNQAQLTANSVTTNLFDIDRALLIGGDGDNLLDATGFDDGAVLMGGLGDDTLLGGAGDDTLNGGEGNDLLDGGTGSDTYVFDGDMPGSDTVVENPNNAGDTLDFNGLTHPIDVDLNMIDQPQQVAPGALELTLFGAPAIENVVGTVFDDSIIGNELGNRLDGGGGLDMLDGGPGDDELRASGGRIVFLDFDTATSGSDHIYTPLERDAIEARMAQDFAPFDITFTQAQPDGGFYNTVFFNDPPIIGNRPQPGGASARVGWRGLQRGGNVIVDVNGFLGQGDNRLLPTSENFIALSSTVASHEIAHLYGARHHDSYGSPGQGIAETTNSARFRPNWNGEFVAGETSSHLAASPSSVGTSLVDALENPHLSERAALKLAFAETGRSISEDDVAQKTGSINVNGSQFVAQELGTLPQINVPNTIEREDATNFGVELDAAAINVAGSLDLIPAGAQDIAENDFYSFQADAGDVVTIEALSSTLRHRLGELTDTILRVYDSTGQKLDYVGTSASLGAFNDDGLEGTDSIILDLVLPAVGGQTVGNTYYVEVDSFSFDIPEVPIYLPNVDFLTYCQENPTDIACTDQDDGQYELLIYRFRNGTTAPAGDMLIGGPGSDMLFGGSGNETFFVDADDIVSDPSGNPNVVIENMPPVLDPIQDQVVVEGSELTFTASATDPDVDDVITYSLEPVTGEIFPAGAAIDSTTGEFSWSPADNGEYRMLVVVTDDLDARDEQAVAITVQNSKPELTSFGVTPKGGRKVTLSAEFVDDGVLDTHTAQIDWGDGTTTMGTIDQIDGTVSAEYTYASGSVYNVSLTLTDNDGDSVTDSSETVVYGAEVLDRTLYVIGTAGEDSVHLKSRNWGNTIRVETKLDNGPKQIQNFASIDIDEIVVDLFASDDWAVVDWFIHHDATIRGRGGDDFIAGGSGNDRLIGGNGADILKGFAGEDRLFGGNGDDRLYGGGGDDHLAAGRGDDKLWGGGGNDVLLGDDGEDELRGENGLDLLVGGKDADKLVSGNTSWWNSAGDILIGGWTQYESLPNTRRSLRLILDDEWVSRWDQADGYVDIVNDLVQAGGSLQPNVQVLNDDHKDELIGKQNKRDLFFAQLVGDDEDDDLKGDKNDQVIELPLP